VDADDMENSPTTDEARHDVAEQQFIDFLDEVEADLSAVSAPEQQAALDRILAEAGYRRDEQHHFIRVVPPVIDLDADDALLPVTGPGVGSTADVEADRLLLRALARAEEQALKDISRQVEQMEATITQKREELGRAQQAIQRARDRAAAIWHEADMDQMEAAAAIRGAREKSDAYQNAAITRAKEIIAKARAEAESIRALAGKFADDLLARTAMKAFSEFTTDSAGDRDRSRFHAVANRHEQLLESSDGASSAAADCGSAPAPAELLENGLASLHERGPAPDPSDRLLHEVDHLGPYLQSKVVLILAVDGDADSLRLISPHNGASTREDTWLGWAHQHGHHPVDRQPRGDGRARAHPARTGRATRVRPTRKARLNRGARHDAHLRKRSTDSGLSDVLRLVTLSFWLAAALVMLLLTVRTSLSASAAFAVGALTLIPRLFEVGSRLRHIRARTIGIRTMRTRTIGTRTIRARTG
jgi:hypothetical protein